MVAARLRVLLAGHDFHQSFDAFDLGARYHTVAEVEDEAGLFACLIQHTLRFDPSNLRGRRQYDGVEITLDRGAVVKCAAYAA